MLMDSLLVLSDAQAVTTSAVADYYINWGASTLANMEIGAGTPLYLNVKVGTGFTSSSNTLTVSLYTHTTSSINSGTLLFSTRAIATSALTTAGTWILRMPLPVNCDLYQYTGLYYTCSSTLATGTIDAWIDDGSQSSYNVQLSSSNI